MRDDEDIIAIVDIHWHSKIRTGYNGWKFLEDASYRIRNDKVFILDVVKRNGRALEFSSKELQNFQGGCDGSSR